MIVVVGSRRQQVSEISKPAGFFISSEEHMGCILPILAIFMPRLVMFFIFLLTDCFNRAFATVLWPVLGFLFMPYTTLVWMAAMLNNDHQMSGFWIILLVVAVLFDLGGQGGTAYRRRGTD